MIRCVRMWTGSDGNSCFEEGILELKKGERGDFIGLPITVSELYFRETVTGGDFDWHLDPVPRFVITLSGVLEFEMKSGKTFQISPGDILLAQDDSGSGHRWKLIGDSPWIRAYVNYEDANNLTFVANHEKE